MSKEGKTCPHCYGSTKCDCGKCGVERPYGTDGVSTYLEKGICEVCGGTGTI